MTKKEMIAMCEANGIVVPKKANVAVLTELLLKADLIEMESEDEEAAEADGAEAEADASAALPPVTREMTTGDVPATKSLKIEKDRPRANGYTRPSIGGICRTIWDACDKLYDSGAAMPTAKQLALQLGVNVSTVGRQSAEWRKFRGLAPKRGASTVEAE
jgi:pyruvate/2-oxoglutarate dehydrogenase complex dihydrolipoamide acyltransferase (E2) component